VNVRNAGEKEGRLRNAEFGVAPDFASQSQKTAISGKRGNAPDQIRTGDLRLERPTLFRGSTESLGSGAYIGARDPDEFRHSAPESA
jgi:hypothetical protein